MIPKSLKRWSGRRGSNPRRPAWEAGILPLNYSRIIFRTDLEPTPVSRFTPTLKLELFYQLVFQVPALAFAYYPWACPVDRPRENGSPKPTRHPLLRAQSGSAPDRPKLNRFLLHKLNVEAPVPKPISTFPHRSPNPLGSLSRPPTPLDCARRRPHSAGPRQSFPA